MSEQDDYEYQIFSNLMDTVFNLATEICEKDEDELTDNEVNFLNAMDEYCDLLDEEDEEEIVNIVKERMKDPEFISMEDIVKGTEFEKYLIKEEK